MIAPTLTHLYLTIIFVIAFLTSPSVSYECIEPTDSLGIKFVRTNCTNSSVQSKLIVSYGLNTTYEVIPATQTNAFELDFTCDSTIDASKCQKAKQAFVQAGEFLTAVFKFPNPIKVLAEFADLCATLSCTNGIVLGSATPTRFLSMIGEDNRIRAYPQILAKIADKTGSLPYVSHDIIASFNSKFDFFLPGDASIGPTQDDLVATITHEFVHGLGFASFWRPWMANTVTPLITHAEDVFPKTVTIRETIFDAFFARMADGQRLSNFTDALQVAIEGTTYNSQAELDNAITAAAANIKLPTTVDFVTPKAIGFWPKGAQDAILIETSFPEFRNGSTGSHVDKETYQNTENWLMIFDNIPGKTYQQIISDNGATGIVGSGIRAMLESIGHATSQNPTPFIPTPTNELPPLTVTSSRKSKRRQRRRLQ